MISVHLQGKPVNITVIQVYAPTSNAEEAEVERFYEDLKDLLELTPKKHSTFSPKSQYFPLIAYLAKHLILWVCTASSKRSCRSS